VSQSNGLGRNGEGAANIVVNLQVVGNPAQSGMAALVNINPTLAASFPDGTSNTIFFSTRYAICGQGGSEWAILVVLPYYTAGLPATAGAYFGQQLPDATGVGTTFQPQPTLAACNPEYAQAFYPSGIQVGLVDGSVRTVSASVSGLTWRNALLPNDGQVLGSDW
jgi:hypothetical protein